MMKSSYNNMTSYNMTSLNTARILEFDVIKCLAIFLVIWGHSIQHLYDDGSSTSVFRIISMFHMPLFMIISGFFCSKSLRLSFKDLVAKKGKQLIYPCISFGIFFLLVCVIASIIDYKTITLSGGLHYLYGIFWFLKCLFGCYILLYICNALMHNNLWGGVIAICLSQFIPLFKMNYMMPFFVTGFWLSSNFDIVRKHLSAIAFTSIGIFILLAILLYEDSYNFKDNIKIVKNGLLNGDVSVLQMYFITQFDRLILGLSGAAAVISSIFLVFHKFKLKRFQKILSSFGSETLGIYIIQTLILETLMARYLDFSNINEYMYTLIVAPILSALIMYFCYMIGKGVKNQVYLRKLFFLQ